MSSWTKQFALAFRLSQGFSTLRHLLHFYQCICLLMSFYPLIPNFLSNLCISSNLSFSLPSYVLMKSKDLVVGARVFVRRWIKSSFPLCAFPFPVIYSICSWIVLPDPFFYFDGSRLSLILSLSSPAFFFTSFSCFFFWSLLIVFHILFYSHPVLLTK